MVSLLTVVAVLAALVLVVAGPVVAFFALLLIRMSKPPLGIPWVGLQEKQWFPKVRAALREVQAGRGPIEDGYRTYSKVGRAFVLPTSQRAEIVLPPTDIAWIAGQPEHILSGTTIQDDGMGLEYLAHGPTLASVHDHTIIRRELTRNLGRILPEEMEEIALALETGFGPYLLNKDEWREVPIHKILQQATVQAVTRIFLGLPICRSEKYISDVHKWAVAFGTSGLVYRTILPQSLKPVIGPLLGIYVSFYQRRAARHTLPMIKNRILRHKSTLSGDGQDLDDKPDDVLQWLIEEAARRPDTAELEPLNIAGKLLMFNLFAEHTTSNTLSTVLFDLLSYKDFPSVLVKLRAECDALLPKLDKNPATLRDMVAMDSVIRETLRFNPMFARGPIKEVVAPDGVTTPGGLHVPAGCHICSSVSAMQRDSEISGVQDAENYEPLRFCTSSSAESATGSPSNAKQRRVAAVQISDRFLAFSLGKHACPGRFFAVQTLKVMLGYLLTHYDFEHLGERPKFAEFGELSMPSESTVVKIKRRTEPQTAEMSI